MRVSHRNVHFRSKNERQGLKSSRGHRTHTGSTMGKKHSANPTDTFRKEQRKKEIKKNKNDRKRTRETGTTPRPRSAAS
jgi:hypothetical protein